MKWEFPATWTLVDFLYHIAISFFFFFFLSAYAAASKLYYAWWHLSQANGPQVLWLLLLFYVGGFGHCLPITLHLLGWNRGQCSLAAPGTKRFPSGSFCGEDGGCSCPADQSSHTDSICKMLHGSSILPKITTGQIHFHSDQWDHFAQTAACSVWLKRNIQMVQSCGLKITNDSEGLVWFGLDLIRGFNYLGTKDSFIFSQIKTILWKSLWLSVPLFTLLFMSVHPRCLGLRRVLFWLFAVGW